MSLVTISRDLSRQLSSLSFGPPVAHVYRPLAYARAPHEAYLRRYGGAPKRWMLVGMNPGPWGMAQTGVPFGAVSWVRDWLGLGESPVLLPDDPHPRRPVLGFACQRDEVSGRRLWSWARERWGEPREFFREAWVANFCPLLFLDQAGRNVTPDKLRRADREALLQPCREALRLTVEALEPARVVGVGAWAEARILEALADLPVEVGRILHPSPASPAANRDWAGRASEQLRQLGIAVPPARGRCEE